MKLPPHPRTREEILSALSALRARDLDARGGRVWSYSYHAGPEVEELAAEAYVSFLGVNGLDPTAFPSLLALENQVVSMLAAHLGGGEETAGTFTSGGTESIILAVKAARDRARELRPELARPEMILPVTAHAAFHKAAHYLGLEVIPAPVDPRSLTVDVEAVRGLVSERTILLVGSAPSYAHGVLDPIAELGALALERDLWLHVDACIGGFVLPFLRRLGRAVPPFDLSVPGVSSLSVDLHKYACCPKGASVVLYRDAELRRHQIFSCSQWTGYSVVNPTVQSSKSGGPLAAAWAVLHAVGEEGYLSMARSLEEATQDLVRGIEALPGLRVLGSPVMSLFAFTSEEVSLFHLADEFKLRGWHVQPQLPFGGAPASIHLTVAPQNVPCVDAFLADLEEAFAAARELGAAAGSQPSPLREALAALPEALAGGEAKELSGLLAAVGAGEGGLPERMAEVNEVLAALPAPASERLLTAFVSELYCGAP